jgi:hypothetical protein
MHHPIILFKTRIELRFHQMLWMDNYYRTSSVIINQQSARWLFLETKFKWKRRGFKGNQGHKYGMFLAPEYFYVVRISDNAFYRFLLIASKLILAMIQFLAEMLILTNIHFIFQLLKPLMACFHWGSYPILVSAFHFLVSLRKPNIYVIDDWTIWQTHLCKEEKICFYLVRMKII